ncbi:hypothetical protein UBN96_11540 [Helicobacter pylori]
MLSSCAQERDGVKLFYQIHCLVDSLSAENIEKLKRTIAPFSAFSGIEFCDISKNDAYPFKLVSQLFLRINPFAKKRFSKMILCRLLLASIFSQYEKIIMFDVDTLFVGDISESFFIPMDGAYFGMVKEDLSLFGLDSLDKFLKNRIDCIRYFELDEESILPTEELITLYRNHFNVGFMIANLKLWRDDNLEEKLCEFFVARNHSLICPEQDTINIVCVNKIYQSRIRIIFLIDYSIEKRLMKNLMFAWFTFLAMKSLRIILISIYLMLQSGMKHFLKPFLHGIFLKITRTNLKIIRTNLKIIRTK